MRRRWRTTRTYLEMSVRHNAHRHRTSPPGYKVHHLAVDYTVLGANQESERVGLQVERDPLSGGHFEQVVPRKGLAHVHGAAMIIEDIKRFGHETATIKVDNEPAMKMQ